MMCEAHTGAVALWCCMTDVSVSSDVDETVEWCVHVYWSCVLVLVLCVQGYVRYYFCTSRVQRGERGDSSLKP